MKVLAQRGDGGSLLIVGTPLKKGRAIVVDLVEPTAFPEWNLNSILARGYWGDVSATPERQAEAIKLARRRAAIDAATNNSE